jgi:hypothetical protein
MPEPQPASSGDAGADGPPTAAPFPPRALPTVRVDSVAEEYAFLAAYPAPSGPWRIAGQALFVGPDGPEDHLRLEAPGGESGVLRVAVGSFHGSESRALARPGAALDGLLEAAVAWAKENEPTHPGVLPRFPVPAAGYPGRVAVPLAFVAADDARRAGLFGPTRVVVVGFPDGAVAGAADAPDFDPDDWPPARLGPWPPPGLDGIGRDRLAATVSRFSAVWTRLLAAYLAGEEYPHRRDEATEALALLARLDPPAMTGAYRAIGPRFWAWLETAEGDDGHPGGQRR